MDQIKIGKFIQDLRKECNLTQEQLGEKLNISKNAVSKWERGINLPDVAIMEELCSILNISLNELFIGERIDDMKEKEKEIDNNIISLLKKDKIINRKYNLNKIILGILIFIIVFFTSHNLAMKIGFIPSDDLSYMQVYDLNDENISGNVDIISFGKMNIAYDIGVNKYGKAVFKDPKLAFNTFKKEYKDEINLIRKEFNLFPISNLNFDTYKTYGWQVITDDEKTRERLSFVTSFLDIYENSFY